jgi:hypothetical protein
MFAVDIKVLFRKGKKRSDAHSVGLLDVNEVFYSK